eukprot:TRINITY_DN80313_c0_g1_i1.p1 TRINITY_DN80313_c0_g1~~TRINITY_DN80313_c0_g1_i1.p1  ORF type:complete len:271 (+),score=69.78 TRINITY_DN80313_c0_g1_i1:40-813(+)
MDKRSLSASSDSRGPSGRRRLGALSVAVLLAGAGAASFVIFNVVFPGVSEVAFCGGGNPQLRSSLPEMASGVAMQGKGQLWSGGMPNQAEIARRKQSFPSLSNMKDTYYILWCRSAKVKQWHPFNIVSGAEAAKALKGVAENDVAKAVGADKLANYQTVKALGMSIYKNMDDVKKSVFGMHPSLKLASTLQFGYKEIKNNTIFNENPGDDLNFKRVKLIPSEEELRNVLDEAGDAVAKAGDAASQVSEKVKGFFNSR